MGYFVKNDRHGSNGFVLPAGPTADRPSTPITGLARYNTDIGSIEYFDGTNFVDLAKTGYSTITVDPFTGDASTLLFTPMSFSYTDPTHIMVFIDGVYQIPTTNYTVSGFNITFTSAPPNLSAISIIHGLGSTYVTSANVIDVPGL